MTHSSHASIFGLTPEDTIKRYRIPEADILHKFQMPETELGKNERRQNTNLKPTNKKKKKVPVRRKAN